MEFTSHLGIQTLDAVDLQIEVRSGALLGLGKVTVVHDLGITGVGLIGIDAVSYTHLLTDCNTLYVGGRKNALDHLDSAMLNGFNPMTTGCQILIADGLKGNDEVEVPVAGGEYVKNAKIGRAVMDADVFISLTHFKGHEEAGFGGCLKNIGMGCGSRAGKMEQHNAGKPHVAEKLCIGCGQCRKICAHGAPIITDGKAVIDHDRCVGCGRCIAVCPKNAVQVNGDETTTNPVSYTHLCWHWYSAAWSPPC